VEGRRAGGWHAGLVLPGGVANPDFLRSDANAVAFVRSARGAAAQRRRHGVNDAGEQGGGDLPAAILDIDGTLVDTNYHHALAWFRAFRRVDLTLPLYRIHRHIGMGGDQLVAALAGEDFDAEHGDDVRELEGAL
jgi:hypothetical protein